MDSAFTPDNGLPADLNTLVPQDDDKGVLATFYIQAVPMGFKSRELGYPVSEDREFVRILVKGNDKMMVEREVTDQDRKRFAAQYEAFKRGASQLKSGTPLNALPGVSPAIEERLNYLGIRTVQDLAEIGDNVLDNLGHGGRTLRDRACAFVGSETPTTLELREEIQKKDEAINQLMARLDKLEQAATEEPAPRPRKRRVKVA